MVVDASVIGHFGACIDGEYCCDAVYFGECFATRVPMEPAAPVTISVSIASLNFWLLCFRFALRY